MRYHVLRHKMRAICKTVRSKRLMQCLAAPLILTTCFLVMVLLAPSPNTTLLVQSILKTPFVSNICLFCGPAGRAWDTTEELSPIPDLERYIALVRDQATQIDKLIAQRINTPDLERCRQVALEAHAQLERAKAFFGLRPSDIEPRFDIVEKLSAMKIQVANILSTSSILKQEKFKNPHNTVICMYGSTRLNAKTYPRFRRFAFDHLGEPDVIIYATPQSGVPEELQHYLNEWKNLAIRYETAVDLDYHAIAATETTYSKCLDRNENKYSNWNGGWPTSLTHEKSIMHQYRGAEMCGVMIREAEKKRGRKYDWVIFSRLDQEYYAPHPVPSFLDPQKVYLPSGSDWLGYNDRHSIFPRHHAEIRFRFHGSLLDGSFNCSWIEEPWDAIINSEIMLRTLLVKNNVSVARIPPFSMIACSQPVHRCQPHEIGKYYDEEMRFYRNQEYLTLMWNMDEIVMKFFNEYLRCSDTSSRVGDESHQS